MYQLLDIVRYIHSQNIMHGDIKPENILVETNGTCYVPKLVDFGLEEMRELTANSSFATRIAKRSINEGYNLDINSALNIEFREYIKTLDSKDRLDALKKYKK